MVCDRMCSSESLGVVGPRGWLCLLNNQLATPRIGVRNRELTFCSPDRPWPLTYVHSSPQRPLRRPRGTLLSFVFGVLVLNGTPWVAR
jgi:hypothetical protein